MSTTPPGWYDDGNGAQRWWDGTRWTEHTQDAATADAPAPAVVVPLTPAEATAEFSAVPPDADAPVASTVADGTGADAASIAAVPLGAVTEGRVAGAGAASSGDTFRSDAAPPVPVPPAGAGYPPSGVDPSAASAAQPAAPAPAKKSRLWIVFVAIGAVVLLLIIAAAVLIPMLITAITGGGGSTGPNPDSGDEQAAVDAVMLYDEAWDTADCDKYFTATTESFRTGIVLTDCAEFEAQSTAFTDTTDNYEVEVVSVITDSENDQITVETLETYDTLIGDDGAQLATPEPAEESFFYVLVQDGDGWAIDSAS